MQDNVDKQVKADEVSTKSQIGLGIFLGILFGLIIVALLAFIVLQGA